MLGAAIISRECAKEKLIKNCEWARKVELVAMLGAHDGCVNSVRYCCNRLVSGSDDRKVCIWAEDGSLAVRLRTAHSHNIFDAMQATDLVVSAGADGRVALSYVERNETKLLFSPNYTCVATKLSFRNTNEFAVACSDARVRFFDLRQKGHDSMLFPVGTTAIDFNPASEREFALGGDDHFLRYCDFGERKVMRRTTPFGEKSRLDVCISGLDWSRDGSSVVANYRGEDICVFKGVTDTKFVWCRGRANVDTCAKEVRFLFGDDVVASGGDDGGLYLWQADTGEPIARLRADRNVLNSIAKHPQRDLVFATSGIDSEIKLWEACAPICQKRTKKSYAAPRRRNPTPKYPFFPTHTMDRRVPQLCNNDALPSLQTSRRRTFADAMDSESSDGRAEASDGEDAGGLWERRYSERPPSLTALGARDQLAKARRLKAQGDDLLVRSKFAAAYQSYSAAKEHTKFAPPSLHQAMCRRKFRAECDLASASVALTLDKPEVAFQLAGRAMALLPGPARTLRAQAARAQRDIAGTKVDNVNLCHENHDNADVSTSQ